MASNPHCKIEGCGKPRYKREWCNAHYQRLRIHGDPLAGTTPRGEPERFLREVVLTYDGLDCLIWPYGKDSRGYGSVNVKGRKDRVHKFVCELVNGPAPTPQHEVAHSCGKGHFGCCAPRHLSWKTHAGNMADMVEHGTSPRGERCGTAILTASQVASIKRQLAEGAAGSALARENGVTPGTIYKINHGETWPDIQPEAKPELVIGRWQT